MAEQVNLNTAKTFFNPGLAQKRRIDRYRQEIGAPSLSEAIRRLVDQGLDHAGIPRSAEGDGDMS